MTMRKIEFTETVRIGTVEYVDGDSKSFPKVDADRYIQSGWAKCCETGETGERKQGAKAIKVDNVKQTSV
jgi:hypothetical protein